MLHQLVDYSPPSWAGADRGFTRPPTHRVRLAQLPTPIHPWSPPPPPRDGEGGGLAGIRCFIKRDDMTSSDASGNKVRKLEFLMADCLLAHSSASSAEGESPLAHDCVLTVGGVQSNHARATAVVARQLGLEPHLLLRGDPASPAFDEGRPESLEGNLLYDRLVGAHVHSVSAEEYASGR